jgi:threonine dehydrogenase-like Zn-dependent dehydrogenase
MKAVVSRGIGDIRLEDVPEPIIQQPTDAIVRITSAAICGTDLHMVRGTMTGMEPGTVLAVGPARAGRSTVCRPRKRAFPSLT